MNPSAPFTDLPALAAHLRNALEEKKFVLLYAYNGTGKTRLSMEFKNIGRQGDARDTLYFNAFTEDLFSWDNDLDGDIDRKLKLNSASHFFNGLAELEMDNRIRPLLRRYVDFDFRIDTDDWFVRFFRDDDPDQNIKVSRGEENIFIWCFFLVIVELAMDGAEAYQWVKYLYIDDPISSLDEHNAITVGNHLARFLERKDHAIKTVISSHHSLFYNVMWNEIKRIDRKFVPCLLSKSRKTGEFQLAYTGDTPFFHHLALLQDLCHAKETGQVYTHHFHSLRSLLEKSSIFHGYKDFATCIRREEDDPDSTLYGRLVNFLSHGNYSFYDPVEMLPENREHFEKILTDFLEYYPFNSALLPQAPAQAEAQ
ncbi:anticodon nuclease [Gluconobacter oxydans]|uniref:AAA family ATPase n=1 Tax=Gluconobacter thailandicus TaxID=257438 RepID=UPI00029985D5|nr:AAA family ATPase [Gluconobacter thailandicus]AFW01303.1 anticodon nuclease [Gluconobacter oxydans H24]ANQ40091.1 anticodon nuclease [Gluconobacter oxydans]